MPGNPVSGVLPRVLSLILLLLTGACSLAGVDLDSNQGLITPSPPPELVQLAPTQIPDGEDISQDSNLSATQIPAACTELQGQVIPFELDLEGGVLTGLVYTPPCFEESSSELYPTMYLLHGATKTEQHWLEIGLVEKADQMILQGQIAPLIIVLPREMTWVPLPENEFGELLIKELVPWVEQNYPAAADRQLRGLGGLSRGGNWAIRLGLLHWGTFGSIAAHSTPLFFGDLNRIPGWIEVIPADFVPRIHLDIGEDDRNLEAAENLHQVLTNLDVGHEWRINPGTHDEDYWRSQLDEYLLWYSDGWNSQQQN